MLAGGLLTFRLDKSRSCRSVSCATWPTSHVASSALPGILNDFRASKRPRAFAREQPECPKLLHSLKCRVSKLLMLPTCSISVLTEHLQMTRLGTS